MTDSNLLFFDDIQIGQTFISHTYTLNEEQIKLFAHEFDPQPFHLDENAAKKYSFGQIRVALKEKLIRTV